MYIQELQLSHFRNYTEYKVLFDPGLNILVAPNGSGKTNILEAIYLLANSKSFRSTDSKQLIQFNQTEAFLGALFNHSHHPFEIACVINSTGKKKFIMNHIPIRVVSDLIGTIKMVFFAPGDLEIVQGSPEARRRVMDIVLNQVDRQYFFYFHQYSQLIKQKNKRLKELQMKGIYIDEIIFVYNQQLSISMEFLIQKRKQWVFETSEFINILIRGVTGEKENVLLSYHPNLKSDVAKSIEAELNKRIQDEVRQGYSMYGIHRDDFTIFHNGKSAKHFASLGQQRLIVLAIKFFEVNYIRRKALDVPIILLDDVLLELDGPRKEIVLQFFKQDAQIIMTVTDVGKIISMQQKPHEIYIKTS